MVTAPQNPFRRVWVTFAPLGGSRIEWELVDCFADPGPYVFQLQFGYGGEPPADDWENVGIPAEDALFLIDGETRLFNTTMEAFYRVVLTTAMETYISPIVSGLSANHFRDWRIARKITRQEFKRGDRFTSLTVSFLRRRRYGPPCSRCLDSLTGEATEANCPVCYGTEFTGGYFAPLRDLFLDLPLEASRELQDERRGTVKDVKLEEVRIANCPFLNSEDVLVEERAGRRWFIKTVRRGAEVRGVTLVYLVEMALAPFTDVIYTVPV